MKRKMKKKTEVKEIIEKEFCVLKDTQYYHGDPNHPKGWSLKIESIVDESGDETPCRGTLSECREWMKTLNRRNIYLSHGVLGYRYRIGEITSTSIEYGEWLDFLDFTDCPIPEGEDGVSEEEILWAENQAYNGNGEIVIQDENCEDILVDLGLEIYTQRRI